MNPKGRPQPARNLRSGRGKSRRLPLNWRTIPVFVTATVLIAVAVVTFVPRSDAQSNLISLSALWMAGVDNLDVPKADETRKGDFSSRDNSPAGVTQAAPVNNNCANAINVTPAIASFTDTRDTTGATDETGEPQSTCTTQSKSIWYNYSNTTANDVAVTVNTCGSNFDTALMVWEQTGAACDFSAFVARSCNNDLAGCGNGSQSGVSFTAAAGKTYKFQVGGHNGATGNLTTHISSHVLVCPASVIHGTLGSGSPDHSFTTGNQTGRLNRNGIASSCATPKTCNIFTSMGARAFDAYPFANVSGVDACTTVNLDVTTLMDADYQVNAYLDSFDPANICANYLADPGVSSGGGPQSPVSMSFTVPSGHSVVLVVHTSNPGEIGGQYTLTVRGDLCLPSGCAALAENFDGVTAPALPAGWVSTLTNGPASCMPTDTCALGTEWSTIATTPDTAPNAAFHNDPSCVTNSTLDSPFFAINSSLAQVTFRHKFDTENTFDGGVLEISLGGGAFTDIVIAGGSFVTGGYTGTISTQFLSPIAGRQAWTGNSAGYITTTANLPAAAAGQSVKLRFRMASDCSGSGVGWRVDSISVADGPCPAARALNISTRMRVETGNNVLIGGFIVSGTTPKSVALRAVGPSLSAVGISDALANPTLELHAANGSLITQNDDWQSDPAQAAQLTALGLALQDPRESGIVATLAAGASYTAILAGKNQTTGVGLVEIYDTNQGVDSQLANISTRGFVLTGNNVMIGGFILGGSSTTRVAVRGIGPSLAQFGLSPVLADPTLELRDSNGTLLIANDDWQDDQASASELTALGLAPQLSKESGIVAALSPGAFTAILSGTSGGTGIGLVEVYNIH